MTRRSLLQTIAKSIKKMATTPPATWRRQWRDRNVRVAETRADYLHLDATFTEHELLIGGCEIMQDWERPLMRALAQAAARNKGDVLEVGFGMGISAGYLIEAGCKSYTVVEPHPGVLARAREWAKRQPVPVHIVEGFWEDVVDQIGMFDGISFDIYPVAKGERTDRFRAFTPDAVAHLRPGGIFAFYVDHESALPEDDMAFLRQHFSKVEIVQVSGLQPPEDCQYFRGTAMIVPVCIK